MTINFVRSLLHFLYLYFRKVSWCSWLSHHLDVVRVPGSNPGETILFCFFLPIYTDRYTDIYTDRYAYQMTVYPYDFVFFPPTSRCWLSYLRVDPTVSTCPRLVFLFFSFFVSSFPCIVLAPVAQLVAALDWRSKGHWFEPGREHSFSFIPLMTM